MFFLKGFSLSFWFDPLSTALVVVGLNSHVRFMGGLNILFIFFFGPFAEDHSLFKALIIPLVFLFFFGALF